MAEKMIFSFFLASFSSAKNFTIAVFVPQLATVEKICIIAMSKKYNPSFSGGIYLVAMMTHRNRPRFTAIAPAPTLDKDLKKLVFTVKIHPF
jgi:hypothetical protein